MIAFILFGFQKPEKSGQKAQQKDGYQEIRVEVMGAILLNYYPKEISPARIVFDRKDPSPCLDQIVFQTLEYMRICQWGDQYVVEITPEQAGEYGFSCGMNMMHGKMIVE